MRTLSATRNATPANFIAKAYYRAFALGALRPHAKTLLPYFNRPNGRFVEVGARDGLKESLTPYLEKALGWKGLLIEPWPHLFHKCRKRRKASVSLNVAAVDRWLHDSFIEIVGLPPAASIRRKLRQEAEERMVGRPIEPPAPKKRKARPISYVTTNSLDHILARANFDQTFDLLILNLVGYETNALEGMDFERYKPTFVMVRSKDRSGVLPTLPPYYERVASSRHDLESDMHLFRFADFGEN